MVSFFYRDRQCMIFLNELTYTHFIVETKEGLLLDKACLIKVKDDWLLIITPKKAKPNYPNVTLRKMHN